MVHRGAFVHLDTRFKLFDSMMQILKCQTHSNTSRYNVIIKGKPVIIFLDCTFLY